MDITPETTLAEIRNEALNPDATVWQFFTVQDMIRRGELDGDTRKPEDIARHLSDPEGTPLTVAEVIELSRQARAYDEQYRSRR